MGTIIIKDVFNIVGIGPVAVAEVTKDTIQIGNKAYLGKDILEIKNIEANHKKLTNASSGQNVAISFSLTRKEKTSLFKKIFSNKDDLYSLLKNYKGKAVEFI